MSSFYQGKHKKILIIFLIIPGTRLSRKQLRVPSVEKLKKEKKDYDLINIRNFM